MGELQQLPLRIKVQLEDEPARVVNTIDYVRARRKTLREFGYTLLTIDTVKEQLAHVLAGHDMDNGLDIIGGFIKRDICGEELSEDE